jgi:hypothetical protein
MRLAVNKYFGDTVESGNPMEVASKADNNWTNRPCVAR